MIEETLLKVDNLSTWFYTDDGIVKAVNDVSFSLNKGHTLGIVGESGCGKSITSLSVMRLIDSPPGKIVGGKIVFKGEDLLAKSEEEMRRVRGKRIAMIFQEPMTSLNPVYTVGRQIEEALLIHESMTKKEAKRRALEMLRLVRIPLPEKRFDEYPHQLSGGMRQRVMIAIALACSPELLICDEPTTALDVTIQAQILALIDELKEKTGTSVIMITHDLGVISEIADEVLIMYAGEIVEYAPKAQLFQNPLHPYTQGLIACVPKLGRDSDRLQTIEGTVPSFDDMPAGCTFWPRCPFAESICKEKKPPLIDCGNRTVRCHRYAGKEEDADER
ncbi:ABC transporter ATP-binding protein [Treponema socranskii]|uniref:Oligopeptide/dipeptide transporter, C-terminal domain protein n=1 Tax=Treponema socranskii subsp. socranskii VPI DR56BR1116 = ATCC 35536 TaxID=1125725 RepID=U1FPP0_TRESO|nr:ABC transporter ATP-binding protein [Treponema socranskii]ERF61476.1 oligopeptide/dipeptide transporter, C-terminal domain protein [Treponema socranskii subsp. socranskii VPI DR56BR1116 = ATCC 35536]ERJ98200.1 oligopeptide/dipeptide transporter, C-terminal domain protein [Treponema socranskii subsp. socranskii VPI DR56BR1116 = ATCC 35536]